MMTESQLLQKKKQIETTKAELSELKGEEKSLIKQLKEDWQCGSLEEAKKKMKELENNAKELDEKIQIKTEQLEQTYFNE